MTCKSCKQEKSIVDFGRYMAKGRKIFSYRKSCKPCRVIEQSERYKTIPGHAERMKLAAKKSALKLSYGLTIEDVQALREKQNNKCAVCHKEPERPLNVDHCHVTGKIRGLLCWNCNIAIGYFKDSITNLLSAIKYLGG